MTTFMKLMGIALLAAVTSCSGPKQGERCNPLLFSDECGAGSMCTYPANCGVAYCCPVTGGTTNPNCQACPAPDAGTDDAATAMNAAPGN